MDCIRNIGGIIIENMIEGKYRKLEKISIILPIYNAEEYLETCLESIKAQTYKHLEVLLVNDGSKDASLDICYRYAQEDKRFKVIDKPNEGVAITRNVGIEHATGEYIAFIDPDDWVEPEMYESMLAKITEYKAPICLCNFYKTTKRRSQPKYFDFDKEVLEDKEIVTELINDMIGMPDLLPKYVYVMGSVWRGLYHAEFIKKEGLRFIPNLTIMEDLVFMVQALLKCNRVAIDHGVWYHYVQHAKSTLHSYNNQLWEDQLVVYQQLEKCLKEANLEEEMRNRLDIRYIGMVLTAIKNEAYAKKDIDLKERLFMIKGIFTDETLKCVLERIKPIHIEKVPEGIESKSIASKASTKKRVKDKKAIKGQNKKVTNKKKVNKKANMDIERLRSLYNKSKDEYNE